MSHSWRWCGVCGCRVYGPAAMLEAPIAYCGEHNRLVVAAEALPADELERLPTFADELELEARRRHAQRSRGA
jgi:hypothetical protein